MAAIATLLAANGCDVRGAEVYGDDDTHGFFCRMVLTGSSTREQLVAIIEPAARGLLLDWELRDLGTRLKVLIAVSKFGRSEERRVGKECVRTGRSGWSPDH